MRSQCADLEDVHRLEIGRQRLTRARPSCLPAPYFYLVFILPPTAEVAFQNKRLLYAALQPSRLDLT